jgi:hypothetical protein
MGVKLGLSREGKRVFEKRVLRRIFEPKRNEVMGEWRKLPVKNFIICTHPQIPFGR